MKGCPPEDAELLIQVSCQLKYITSHDARYCTTVTPINDSLLFQHWELEFKQGNTEERPDSYTYVALIKSWIATNRVGYEEKCRKFLDWMEENEVVGMNRYAAVAHASEHALN